MEVQTGLEIFLDVIEDEVQELVETLENTGHCNGIDHLEHQLVARRGEVAARAPSRPPVNFTLIFSFIYLDRSRIASRFGLSIVGCGPCGPWCLPPPLDEFPGPPLRWPPLEGPPLPLNQCQNGIFQLTGLRSLDLPWTIDSDPEGDVRATRSRVGSLPLARLQIIVKMC